MGTTRRDRGRRRKRSAMIWRRLWRSRQLDADMQEEMRFHVQMEAERLTRVIAEHGERGIWHLGLPDD